MSMSGSGDIVEWEWSSDDQHWIAYSASCSSLIEEAYAAGFSSVPLCLSSNPSTSHTIIFEGLPQRQVNVRTLRSRPVRRQVLGGGPVGQRVSWEWWEVERGTWTPYAAAAASQIEAAWAECSSSRACNRANGPSGLLLCIRNHWYTIEFETDARQCNNSTMFCRGVRRRAVSQPAAPAASRACRFTLPWTRSRTARDPAAQGQQEAQATQESHPIPSLIPITGLVPVTVPAPVHLGQVNSPSLNEEYFIPFPDCNESDDCPICICSLTAWEAVKLSKCRHAYHRACIQQWFRSKPTCPECATPHGVILGTQPAGEMKVRYVTRESEGGLSGYPHTDVIEISYYFPSGIQTDEHPNPGRAYTGTRRVAYLPKNKDGEDILDLLKTAWQRKLLFTVGTSVTTGRQNQVIWAGIHHKTNKQGGAEYYGYPDDTYFARVRSELAAVGVTSL